MVVDDLGDGPFVRLLQVVSWGLVVIFTIPAVMLTVYQLFALYIPYTVAKITGNTEYKFPAYVYRVWDEEMTDLTMEHWGYLICCILVTSFSASWIIPYTPWSDKDRARMRTAAKDKKE